MIPLMKRITAFLSILFLFLSLNTKSVSADIYLFPGQGTVDSPFQISEPQDFVTMAVKVNEGDEVYSNAYYNLMNDVDLSINGNHKPIGFGANYSFNGVFEGNGNKLTNMNLEYDNIRGSTNYIGLFGYNKGNIQNIEVTGEIRIIGFSGAYAGSITGYNSGLISNVSNSINLNGYITGGISGYNSGTIKNSVNSGRISGWASASINGGISGINRGLIDKTKNYGTVTGMYTGGISGENHSEIKSSVNIGSILASSSGGGIVARNGSSFSTSKITDTLNIGAVSGNTIGGLAGENGTNGHINTSYSIGNINGPNKGALIGNNLGIVNSLYYNSFYEKGIYTGGGTSIALDNTSFSSSSSFTGYDFNLAWTMNTGTIGIPVPQGIGDLGLPASKSFSGGNGTVLNPFLISDTQGLDEIRNHTGAFFELKNSLIFEDAQYGLYGEYYNNGYYWNPINEFFGYFDGKGFLIENIKIQGNNSTLLYGLFGSLYGSVKNTHLKNISYDTNQAIGSAGAFAGLTRYGSIENVSTSGKISNFPSIGGITEKLEGVITKAFNRVSINALASAGGIVNTAYKSTLVLTANYGDVSGVNAGGIVQQLNSSIISKAMNSGDIIGRSGRSGTYAGGIAAGSYGSSISDTFNIGVVIANDLTGDSGGIAGTASGNITNSYSLGYQSAGRMIGGIVGNISSGGTLSTSNSYYLDVYHSRTSNKNELGIETSLENFRNSSNYTDFDFNDVWQFDTNSSYPFASLKGLDIDKLTVQYTVPGTTVKAFPAFVLPGEKIDQPSYSNMESYYIQHWLTPENQEWNFEEDTVDASMILTGKWIYQHNFLELEGANRFGTAVEISKFTYQKTNTAILVQADNFPDALAAAPLAFKLNAPILLTNTPWLSGTTKNELERLQVKDIVIMGGPSAVSQAVENNLIQEGYNVSRIYGDNRYQTAYETATYLNDGSIRKAVLTSGVSFADALAAGSFAAKEGIPILLTNVNTLSSSTVKALTELNIEEVIIVGGLSVISVNVENTIKDMNIITSRVAGSNRVQTSTLFAEQYFGDSDSVLVANGWVFADALAAAPLAAKYNMPIILSRSNNLSTTAVNYLSSKILRRIYIVGGDAAIDSYVRSQLENLMLE